MTLKKYASFKFVDIAQLLRIEHHSLITIFLQSVILKMYTMYVILNS